MNEEIHMVHGIKLLNTVNVICIYVTVKLCNQGFREIPKIFRDFAKSLVTQLYCNIYLISRRHDIP